MPRNRQGIADRRLSPALGHVAKRRASANGRLPADIGPASSGSSRPAAMDLAGKSDLIAVEVLLQGSAKDRGKNFGRSEGVAIRVYHRRPTLGRVGSSPTVEPGHASENGAIGDAPPEPAGSPSSDSTM